MFKLAALLVVALATVVAVKVNSSSAQYGPPPGSAVCNTSVTITQPNSVVQITAIITDSSNVPLAGKTVDFQIVSQPGGATLQVNQPVTNSNGQAFATLTTGPNAGSIVVSCTAEEVNVQSQVVTEVRSESIFVAPAVGDAGLKDTD
jgi:hypothetical protein